MPELSHLDAENRPRMVDVSDKPDCHRLARASGRICLQPGTVRLIATSQIRKGNVLITAELAGIQAAKRTATLIPLCHNLNLGKVNVTATLLEDAVQVESEVKCVGNTGVEMEALTAVSVALLTIYDMCKAVDKQMTIADVRLLEKSKTPVLP